MFYFISDLLRDMRRYLVPELIPAAAFDIAAPVNRRIPLDMVNIVGFEIRLNAQDSQADFLYGIRAAQRHRLAKLKSPVFNDTSWDQVRDFVQAWGDQTSPLYDYVEWFWAEFDGIQARVTIPGVYIEPPQPLGEVPTLWKNNPTILFDEALPRLLGQPIHADVRRRAEACIAQLPAEFGLFAAGLFLSRGADFLRINFENVSLPLLLDYLRAIQWTGELDAIQSLWERYFDGVRDGVFRVALDMQADTLPRLGIELHQRALSPVEAEVWNPVFERLTADGLCAPEKANALKQFIGNVKVKLPIHTEPVILNRAFAHIKLTYQLQQPLQAKAYFCMRLIPTS